MGALNTSPYRRAFADTGFGDGEGRKFDLPACLPPLKLGQIPQPGARQQVRFCQERGRGFDSRGHSRARGARSRFGVATGIGKENAGQAAARQNPRRSPLRLAGRVAIPDFLDLAPDLQAR